MQRITNSVISKLITFFYIMELITSKDNKRIKTVKKLIASASFRREESLFTAEGLRLCGDALSSGAQIESAYFSEDFLTKHPDFAERAEAAVKSCFVLKNSIFSALCDTKTPQGVLFVIKTLDKTLDFDKMKKNGKVVALENIQDPTNLGTILRSAEAFGVDMVALSRDCCDIYAPKVIRGSMGAIFRQPFVIVDDMAAFIRDFNAIGASYAAVLDRDSTALSACDFSGAALCAVGNEGNGLSAAVIAACMQKVFIPMRGGAESLNASAAASICFIGRRL